MSEDNENNNIDTNDKIRLRELLELANADFSSENFSDELLMAGCAL